MRRRWKDPADRAVLWAVVLTATSVGGLLAVIIAALTTHHPT
ncbi:hypothetical protein OK074_5373 [Actinobacteria bacterium OK074]|nr:hypothetical protein OK074_5373 [Actinobacteria bacterium OK074]